MADKQNKVFLAQFSVKYIGGDAVVVAPTKRQAFNLLKKRLDELGLPKYEPLTMGDLYEVPMDKKQIFSLNDGDY